MWFNRLVIAFTISFFLNIPKAQPLQHTPTITNIKMSSNNDNNTGTTAGTNGGSNAGTGSRSGGNTGETGAGNNSGRSNRNRGRGGYRGNSGSQQRAPRIEKPKFEGLCEGLKGHIYDCNSPKHAERFEKTTEVIAEYVNREYTHGSYL